jgi:aspartate aminotransferase
MWKAIDDLEALLAPQERFDELSAVARRRFGPRLVDLSYANPYDGPAPEVRRALQRSVDEDTELGFQYTPFGGRTTTRRLIASRLSQESGLPFAFRDVVMTPGAMAALNVVLSTLFTPGDEVILPTPCWQDHPLYLEHLGLRARLVERRADKHLDVAAIDHVLSGQTRGLLLSDPCCPTGVVYGHEELQELADRLHRAEQRFGTRIYWISDEVHRYLVWGGRAFQSPLLSYPRVLSVYSFGKTLFLQGQRIGYVAVSPSMPERAELARRLERGLRVTGFCAPTTLMQRAVCRLLDYQPPLDELAARQAVVRHALREYGYAICDADATFFVYVKSPIADDVKFVELLAEHGVLVLPSTLFHEQGYFRISVTPRREALVDALPVFERMLALV